MAVVSIEYDDGDQSTYKHIEIQYGRSFKDIKIFNSGDFIKDWYDHNKFIITVLLDIEYHICNSSSVDHFIMDGDAYDSVYLINLELEDGKFEILSLKDYNKDKTHPVARLDAIEYFVPAGETWTWDEMKQKFDI